LRLTNAVIEVFKIFRIDEERVVMKGEVADPGLQFKGQLKHHTIKSVVV